MEAARCTVKVSGRDLRLARALQRATLVGADDLVLETLEKELPTTARAQGLVALIPDGRLPTADVVVSGTQLLNGRPARARGYEHLTQAVAAEIAIELSSKGHLSRNLQGRNGKDRSFVPIPSIGHFGFRIPRYASPGAAVLVCRGFFEGLLVAFTSRETRGLRGSRG